MDFHLASYTDVLGDADEIENSQPLSLSSTPESVPRVGLSLGRLNQMENANNGQLNVNNSKTIRPARRTGQHGEFRSVEEIDPKYRDVFSYPYFNLVQSRVIDEALYSDKSMVVCAPTGSGKTVIFEMAIVQLLMELDDMQYTGDFKIIYMAPVKALCTERLSEWYPKFTKLGLMCIEVTGDTNVDFSQLKPYRVIITTPEKWDMLTRRWRDHRALVEVIKLFLIDEVHILNDECRGPVLEAVVSRMKTIESSSQSAYRIEQLQKQYQSNTDADETNKNNEPSLPVRIRFVAVSATVSNPEDVAAWLGTNDKPAVYYKFGDECRPVKLKRVVEGYPCSEGTSIFKFDIILNYKLWPVIQKYHNGKPTLIFCNTRKSVAMTAEMLSRELTINFTPEQKARLTALACTIKNKKLQALVLSGVGCHHAGLLFEERLNIEEAFRNRDLPILITTTTLAMGVNLPAHLVIIKNTQQYVNGAYQEYSISTVLQMVGRAGRPQFDTEATAVIMTRLQDKPRYQALVGGDEPLQSYLHKRLAENLNSEAALGTVCDVAQCVQWLRSTFLSVRAAKDPKRYLGLPPNAQPALITKKIEELCVKAMNGLASTGLITMDEASCIESTEAGRLMSVFYLDLETMKHIMKIDGTESLEKLLWIVCESHELADMHLRVDERRTLNTLNRNNAAATIRFPMKGKISTRQMKLNCIIQAVLGCLPITDPSLNQEAMKVMRIADRVCKCLVAYVTRPDIISSQPQYYSAVLNALLLNKCIQAHLWENSPYVSKQLKGIGPTFSTLLASAGKVNFALLEEAHPRDLERIMNKGAPAGNVLRKQVTLLPKYQLTATPIDEKRISIQLLLLNQHQLAENRDHLTAGDAHRAYLLVGDSHNYVLLFTSFKDKDLISVYDGSLTYEITRKHAFEHKILIHCISSNWVGIDAQCDYTFKNIEPPFLRGEAFNTIPTPGTPEKPCTKQTSITDVYRQRKRKNNDIDLTESKEKKKRESALVDKFKHLKNTFEITSKELRDDLDKSAQMSNMIVNEMMQPDNSQRIQNQTVITAPENKNNDLMNPHMENNIIDVETYKPRPAPTQEYDYPTIDTENLDEEDNFEVDDKIDSILNQIENEIHGTKDCISDPPKNINSFSTFNIPQEQPKEKSQPVQSAFFTTPIHKGFNQKSPSVVSTNTCLSKLNEKKKRRAMSTKTNYSFIDALEKKVDLENDAELTQKNHTGFSNTIKNQIEKFLQKTVHAKQHDDTTIIGLIDFKEQLTPNKISETPKINDCVPSSLALPSGSINSDNLATNNHDESKNSSESKESSIKPKLLGPNNVQNIDKIVDNILRDYDLTTKESEGNVHTDQAIQEHTNMPFGDLHDVNATHCDTHVNIKPSDDIVKDHCRVNNVENNIREDESDMKKIEVRNDLIIEKPVQILSENKVSVPGNKTADIVKTMIDNAYESKVHTGNYSKSMKELRCVGENISTLNSNQRLEKNLHSFLDVTSQAEYLPSVSKQVLPTFSIQESTQHLRPSSDFLNITEKDCNEQNTCKSSRKCVPRLPLSIEGKPKKKTNINFEHYHSTEEGTKNVNSEEHINRYTFSVTKIDVCTKKTSEHNIRLIRKLKLDLDVTEIVSKGDYCSIDCGKQETNIFESSNECDEKINNNRKEKTHAPLTHSMLKIQNGDKNITRNDEDKASYKSNASYVIKDNDRHFKPYLALRGPKTELKNTGSSKIEVVKTKTLAEETNENSRKSDKCESKILNEEHKNRKTQEIEHYKKYLREIAANKEAKCVMEDENIYNSKEKAQTVSTEETNLMPDKSNTAMQINKPPEKTKCNKIENILQKYSSILGKGNKIFNTTKLDHITETHDKTHKAIQKPQKPFKISDIHNIHIPLPKTLIAVEATRAPRPVNDDILSRMNVIEEGEESNLPIGNTPKFVKTENNTTVGYIKQDLPDDIPGYDSLVTDISELELPEENYDLDQSMLNPKTLLEQCFLENTVNDEIIPPPPSFCDELSSPKLLQDDLLKNLSSPEYPETDLDYNTAKYDHDKSIFEEDTHSVLTPSVEIETWTLSRDDEMVSADYLNQYTPNTSCTVMRRNPPVIREPLSDQFEIRPSSRRGKLGEAVRCIMSCCVDCVVDSLGFDNVTKRTSSIR